MMAQTASDHLELYALRVLKQSDNRSIWAGMTGDPIGYEV